MRILEIGEGGRAILGTLRQERSQEDAIEKAIAMLSNVGGRIFFPLIEAYGYDFSRGRLVGNGDPADVLSTTALIDMMWPNVGCYPRLLAAFNARYPYKKAKVLPLMGLEGWLEVLEVARTVKAPEKRERFFSRGLEEVARAERRIPGGVVAIDVEAPVERVV